MCARKIILNIKKQGRISFKKVKVKEKVFETHDDRAFIQWDSGLHCSIVRLLGAPLLCNDRNEQHRGAGGAARMSRCVWGRNRRIKARFDRCRHPISITALVAVIEILLWNTRFCTDLFNGYEVKFRSAICRFGGFGCFCRWFGLDFGCRFSWLIHWFSQIKCWCSHCGGFRTACTHT